ncbi:hypothetical protein [Streptomyces atratus]
MRTSCTKSWGEELGSQDGSFCDDISDNFLVQTAAAQENNAVLTPHSPQPSRLTATGSTPAPVLQVLLHHLAYNDGWDTALGSPVDEKTVTAATQPLSDAGWQHTVDGRWIRWTSPAGDAGAQFDAFVAQHPIQNLDTWTVWAGPSLDHAGAVTLGERVG